MLTDEWTQKWMPISHSLQAGATKTKLQVATLKKFYGRHYDLVNPYNVAVSTNVSDVFANDET